MSILLELDPNIVKPGWTPLLITIGIALAMVLLFRSMRRQFRRVDENFPEPPRPTAGTSTPSSGPPSDVPVSDGDPDIDSGAEPRRRA